MFCSECGVSINNDAKFCGVCGAAQLNSEQLLKQPTANADLTTNAISSSGNVPLAYIKAIGAIIVIVAIVVVIYFVSSKNEDAPVVATSEDTQAVVVPSQTAEEKARLAAEGERMRAASVEREKTGGKTEQEPLRIEADPLADAYKAYDAKDYVLTIKIIRPLALKGVANAQSMLGWMYDSGQGVAQDYAEAFKWYKLAAVQGDANALTNLGVMYDKGNGVAQDYAEAFKWYKLLAAQGDARGQFTLGFMYHNGQGVVQDYAEAVKWYKLAAAQGDDVAKQQISKIQALQKNTKALVCFNSCTSPDRTLACLSRYNNNGSICTQLAASCAQACGAYQ